MAPPVIILGVGRSGTTLLRVMLDRSSELAIPYETFFVPQLAHRHGRRPKLDDFLDDLGRLRTLYDWGIKPDDVRRRLHEAMTTSEALAAIFETYAERQGKPRWGDKTPLYMQQLPLLERLFPDAVWVHLVRDGRDAALSFLELPEGFSGKTWALPRTVPQFAARWRTEILAARRLGRHAGSRYLELRYEDLVDEPERRLRLVCEHASLAWNLHDLHRLEYFEQVAGDVLRSSGYELLEPDARYPTAHGRLELARFAALSKSWNATAAAYQRSPLWRRSHPPLG